VDYQELLRKKELYSQCRASIPDFTLLTFEQAFEIEYTHNSTAIEGNTLSLIETKVLLEDGISIGGKNLREIYEAVNHRRAFRPYRLRRRISWSISKHWMFTLWREICSRLPIWWQGS